MRVTTMEVNIDTFKNNVKNIKKYIGNKKIMPVIKANAYGTYINKRLDVINEFDIVAVAIVDEAIELRKLGYKKEIFVLNQPSIDELLEIVKYNIIIGLSSMEFLKELLKQKINIKVHLEIETGMNRTGIKMDDINKFIELLKQTPSIKVEGIYTHLSSADYDLKYTNNQLQIFKKAVSIIKKHFNNIVYIHSSASNGILNCNDDISNLVRPGLIMYGYEPFIGAKKKIDISPVCKLKTKVTFIKDINPGESISYSRKFIAKEKMVVATIPIGYADGLMRELSNVGEVVINNKKAKIIGNICMDSCMADITNIKNVFVGTDVYVFDNENITLENISEQCDTINYEVLSNVSSRVPRIFISDND